MKQITYPIRINKYLAYKNYGTRREADELISKKCVYINGQKAVLGDIVQKGDLVDVKQKVKKDYIYIAYNKPRNVITHSPDEHETDVQQSIGRTDVFPVGRLDKDSEGLILLTNDGRLTDRLLHPDSNYEKEYVVTVNKDVSQSDIRKLEAGINIEGYKTKKAQAKKLSEKKISIILTEGKKHQIRRMLAAIGFTTINLKRTRILNIRLQSLKENESRKIVGDNLKMFLDTVGL